jgi:hypothetical protein
LTIGASHAHADGIHTVMAAGHDGRQSYSGKPVQNLIRQLAVDDIPIGNVKTKPRVSSQIVAPCQRRRADDFLEETRMDSTVPSAAPLPPSEHQTQLRRAVIASTVGTAIEWYDFFLYSTVTGLVFAKLYFPQSDPWVGTLQAFAIYASVIAGGPAPLIAAALLAHFRSGYAIAAYILVCALISIASAAMLTDHTDKDISREYQVA